MGRPATSRESAVTLRRRVYQALIAQLEDAGARVADRNVGISEATRRRIPGISDIVPCGVDTELFHPGPKSDGPTLLFVGTTGGRKRGTLLADIFTREIRPRFPAAQLWAVAEKPLAGEGIINFGKIPLEEITDLFRRAWVFCLPSTYEGFGVPYIEALASGTAVVASPNPGACEILDEGRFGVLASDADLGAAINTLLGSEEERNRFARLGPARAALYDWDAVTQMYERHYDELRALFPTPDEISPQPLPVRLDKV